MKSLMHVTKQMKRTFHIKGRNVSWKLKHQQSPGATPTLQFFPILRGSSTESSKFQTVWGVTLWTTCTSKRLSRWMTSATFLLWTINLEAGRRCCCGWCGDSRRKGHPLTTPCWVEKTHVHIDCGCVDVGAACGRFYQDAKFWEDMHQIQECLSLQWLWGQRWG